MYTMRLVSGDFMGCKANLNHLDQKSATDAKLVIDISQRKRGLGATLVRLKVPDDLASIQIVGKELRRIMPGSRYKGSDLIGVGLAYVLLTSKLPTAIALMPVLMLLSWWGYRFYFYKEEWITASVQTKSGQKFIAVFEAPEWKSLEFFCPFLGAGNI
jgi:hypothetical protein